MFSRVQSFVAVASLFFSPLIAAQDAEKPNIIVIMADDLGYADVGFNGCRDIPTPNIDRLAKDGARFTSGYVTGSMCGPSRAGFLTGKVQSTFGWYKNPRQPLNPTHGLPKGIKTIASEMQNLGYRTGGVGKWHMGTAPDQHPNALGFDDWYGFLSGGRYYYPNDHPNYEGKYLTKEEPWDVRRVHHTLPLMHNDEVLEWDQYLTRELTDYSLKFIDDNEEKPFFLFVSYNAPHLELEAPEETIALFPPDKMTQVPGVTPESRSIYAAMTYEMDQGIGQIIRDLEEKDLLENTLIWFLSDNGGMRKTSDNRPLRGSKGSLYEGGLRVPFVAHWPKKIHAGTQVEHAVTSLDIGATSVVLAGGDLAKTDFDGVDLSEAFAGGGAPHQELYWSWSYHEGNQNSRRGVILKDGYKLILEGTQNKLFHISDDLSENEDLSETELDLVEALSARWQEFNKASRPNIFKETQKGPNAYQYANYEWLKGTPHYKESADLLAP